ncbi:MAG: hypothetical protein MRZ84_10790 [Eubacterium sp.]|nr:hypothetical protein [Eubacterium sp.]
MEINIKEESGLKFAFPKKNTVVKFDDTRFYRAYFNKLPESKGVDFISADKNKIVFIEVKNCVGDEGNCRWRIVPNNQKRETTHTSVNIEGRDSLDIEVSQKIAMTIAALCGAKSFGDTKECLKELKSFIQFLSSDTFSGDSKKKYVILFLEGDFGGRTRTKKMIMKALQDSINKKLQWINCRVSVVDSDTYDPKIFQIVS